MPGRWNLQQLRIFAAAAEHENFHRAAEQLRIAQPAVSKQVRDLEAWLGIELFERLPRGVRLTSTGRAVADDVKQILDQLEGVRDRAREAHEGVRGRLRFGMNESGVTCALTSRIIRRFKAKFPMISLEVFPMHSRRQIEALEEGVIDVGLMLSTYVSPEVFDWIDCSPVTISMALYKGHRLAGQPTISVTDLDEEPIVWTAHDPGEISHHMRLLKLRSRLTQVSPTPEVTLQLVACEFGIAPFHMPLTRMHPNVVFRPLREQPDNVFTCLAWSKQDASEQVRNFAEVALETKEAAVAETANGSGPGREKLAPRSRTPSLRS